MSCSLVGSSIDSPNINDVCYRPLWVLILEFIPLEILLLLKSSGQSRESFVIFLQHSSKVMSTISLIIQKKKKTENINS